MVCCPLILRFPPCIPVFCLWSPPAFSVPLYRLFYVLRMTKQMILRERNLSVKACFCGIHHSAVEHRYCSLSTHDRILLRPFVLRFPLSTTGLAQALLVDVMVSSHYRRQWQGALVQVRGQSDGDMIARLCGVNCVLTVLTRPCV